MNAWFGGLTVVFIILSAVMILIILVQRPTGGGLAGAFGGASGGGTDTVFGGRVGDALTYFTVACFIGWLGLAVSLNLVESQNIVQPVSVTEEIGDPDSGLPGSGPTPINTNTSGPIRIETSPTPTDTNAPADTGGTDQQPE